MQGAQNQEPTDTQKQGTAAAEFGSRARSANSAAPHRRNPQVFRNAAAVYNVSKPPIMATRIAPAALSHTPTTGTPCRVTYVPDETKSPSRPMP